MSIKMFGKSAIGEILHAQQELDNAIVGVLTNFVVFFHMWRKISLEVSHCRCHCKHLYVGMEIPCRLVLSCSSKAKINSLKELLESKVRR